MSPTGGAILVLILFSTSTSAQSSIKPALSFTRLEADRDVKLSDVLNKIDDPDDEVVDMSWCMRLALDSLHHTSVITGANTGHNLIEPKPIRGSIFLKGVSFIFLAERTELWPEYWSPECLTYNFKNNTLKLMIKGEMVMDRMNLDPTIAAKDFQLPFAENVIISPSKKTMPYGDAYRGLVSDVYVWKRTISLEEMEKYTTDCTYEPDKRDLILDWDDLNEDYNGSVKVEQVDLCASRLGTGEASVGMIPIEVPFEEAEASCIRMGGRLADPDDADFVELMERADPTGLNCSHQLWAPFKKIKGQDVWYNTNSKETYEKDKVPFYWQPGQPNGWDLQTCLTMHLIDGKETIWDDSCVNTHCCFGCRFERLPKVAVRGEVCPENGYFDRDYFLVTYKAAVFFRGFSGTIVQLNENGETWDVINDKEEKIGRVTGDGVTTPMGKGEWEFNNCQTGSNLTTVKMTQCTEDEFTCNDGTCIPLIQRCDEYSHCADLSDEDGCVMIAMDHQNYRKEFAPTSSGSDEDSTGESRAKINVDIHVDKITKVQELEMTMRVKFSVGFAWFDPRLTFRNIKDDAGLNTILETEAEEIWFPPLQFDNALEDRKVTVDLWSKMFVKRQADGTLNQVQDVDEAFMFDGEFNRITFTREYEHDFSCIFNLDLYPFDTQICDMWIITPSGQGLGKAIGLDLGELTVSPAENISLTQFVVTNTQLLQYNTTDAVVQITFERSLLYHFATTYIPTTCLIIICEATLFVEGTHHFETVTMVTLTAKLVLFTVYQTISATLPRTARLKLIDIWFLFGFLTCFFVFLLLVVIEVLSTSKKNFKMARKIKNLNTNTIRVRNMQQAEKPEKIGSANWIVGDEKHFKDEFPNIVDEEESSGRIMGVFIRNLARVAVPTFTAVFIIVYWISAVVRSNNA